MVEAVSSVNNAVKTYFQQKKNQDIAWKNLTADEIIKYINQGEDVPEEIKRWATEVQKLQDIPDDITYDSVNGSSNKDEINNTRADSDEPDADDAAEKTTMTQAQQFRQNLELDGMSKYDQGKTMSDQSVTATRAEGTMATRLSEIQELSEVLSSQAENKADETVQKTSSMKQELNQLIEKAKSGDKSLTPADFNRISELGNILNATGLQVQAEIGDIGNQISALDNEIIQFENIAPTATDFGTETVAIGSELVTSNTDKQNEIKNAAQTAKGNDTAKVAVNVAKYNTFRFMFDRNYRMGLTAIKNGGNAMDAGTEGQGLYTSAQANIDTQVGRVENAQAKIEDSTGVAGTNIQRSDKSEDNNTDNPDNRKDEEVKISANKTEEKDVKDGTLVIDDDEKKKRREETGLA